MAKTDESIEIVKKRKTMMSAVRSLALLLLALILAIFAAFAWFGDSNDASISGTSFSVSGEDIAVNENNNYNPAPLVNDKLYVPAATKINDTDISNDDLDKVVTFRSYTVSSDKPGYVKIDVTDTFGSDCHYLVTSSAPSWASAIKNQTGVDTATNYIQLSQASSGYSADVYLVIYSDYNDNGRPKSVFPDNASQGTREDNYGTVSLNFSHSQTNPNA